MISTGHGVRFQAGAVFSLLCSVQTALVPTRRPVQLNELWELSNIDKELNAWSHASILQALLTCCQIKHKQNFCFFKIATPCSLVWVGRRFDGTQASIFRLCIALCTLIVCLKNSCSISSGLPHFRPSHSTRRPSS